MAERSEQEEFLVAKMVERTKVLQRENALYEKQLEKENLSDRDYDLYQGLMDKNIGEMAAMRRMEDNLREWREIQRAKEIAIEPNAHCDYVEKASGEQCVKAPKHLGGHVDSVGENIG